jgi:hypothetical protein
VAKVITKFDAPTARLLSDRITAALQPLAAEYGITIRTGRGSYSGSQFTVKVECIAAAKDGAPAGREADAFRHNAHLYGLEASDLGREFTTAGRTFRIIGLSTRAPKRPILADDVSTGTTFKFTETAVCSYLGRPIPKLPYAVK